MTNPVSDDRLRNTRAWAAARVGTLSGAEVIVAAIDEVFRLRAEISERKFFDNIPSASPEMIAEARRQGKLPQDEPARDCCSCGCHQSGSLCMECCEGPSPNRGGK